MYSHLNAVPILCCWPKVATGPSRTVSNSAVPTCDRSENPATHQRAECARFQRRDDGGPLKEGEWLYKQRLEGKVFILPRKTVPGVFRRRGAETRGSFTRRAEGVDFQNAAHSLALGDRRRRGGGSNKSGENVTQDKFWIRNGGQFRHAAGVD